MASESNLTGFGGSVDAVTADWYLGSRYPDLLAFENGAFFSDASGLFLSPQAPLLHATEPFPTYFPEIPPDTSSILGVTQNTFHPPQASHEASNYQRHTTATPPRTVFPTTPHNGVMGAESWFTGLTQSSSGSLIQPTPPSPLVTNLPSNWIKVPQKSYDHGRKQWNFRRSEPISFHVNGRPGINMGDALRKVFAGLDGRDDPALQDPPGTISCRLLFPGYPANNSSCQIHVLDWTRNRLPITRSKLAHEVAKKLEWYLKYITKFTLDGSVEDRWRVGEGFMRIDNMFLVRLVSVSRGSFQPEIWVVDHSTPHVLASCE